MYVWLFWKSGADFHPNTEKSAEANWDEAQQKASPFHINAWRVLKFSVYFYILGRGHLTESHLKTKEIRNKDRTCSVRIHQSWGKLRKGTAFFFLNYVFHVKVLHSMWIFYNNNIYKKCFAIWGLLIHPQQPFSATNRQHADHSHMICLHHSFAYLLHLLRTCNRSPVCTQTREHSPTFPALVSFNAPVGRSIRFEAE